MVFHNSYTITFTLLTFTEHVTAIHLRLSILTTVQAAAMGRCCVYVFHFGLLLSVIIA